MQKSKFTSILTKKFFEEYYIQRGMSFSKISLMLNTKGHKIHSSTIYSYARRLGIGRTISESMRSLDYSLSFMTEEVIEAVDGFLLGDGSISHNNKVARLCCGLKYEEFAKYLIYHFDAYLPSVSGYRDTSMSSGTQWQGRTKFHPDLYKHYKRWYFSGDSKQPPDDVRITPKSVMMWYLGDGSIVQKNNTAVLRLSTDGFSVERVCFLSNRLKTLGILCHRNGDNRIMIEARGIPAFFGFIGRKSPVECYNYKFALPKWRYTAKRMKDVANDLSVSYNRLSYLVKIGKLKCYRASEKGRPRMLPEHIKSAKELIKSGELY